MTSLWKNTPIGMAAIIVADSLATVFSIKMFMIIPMGPGMGFHVQI